MDYIGSLFPDAIAISIVAFAISVSMASLMGKRNNYEIDSNQVSLRFQNAYIKTSMYGNMNNISVEDKHNIII